VNGSWSLGNEQLTRVCATAAILLAGSGNSPAPGSLPEFEALVQRAANALWRESSALEEAIARLPAELTWDSLSAYADAEPESFELLALVVVGAYFMSPAVLAALGLPTGDRRPAPLEQAVDELSSGILDAVLDRGSPVKTLQEIGRIEGTA
jgi:hypothetical protein